MTFKYKDKIYTTADLDNKLGKLGIRLEDVEILKKQDCSIGEVSNSVTKHRFYNKKTGYTLVSIYDNLDHLQAVENPQEW